MTPPKATGASEAPQLWLDGQAEEPRRLSPARRRRDVACDVCGDTGLATEQGRLRRCPSCKALPDSRGEAALGRQKERDARLEELRAEPSMPFGGGGPSPPPPPANDVPDDTPPAPPLEDGWWREEPPPPPPPPGGAGRPRPARRPPPERQHRDVACDVCGDSGLVSEQGQLCRCPCNAPPPEPSGPSGEPGFDDGPYAHLNDSGDLAAKMRKVSYVRIVNVVRVEVLRDLAGRLTSYPKLQAIARSAAANLAGCGARVKYYTCHGRAKVSTKCCASPFCLREERHRSARWTSRLMRLANTVKVPPGYEWVASEFAPRQSGNPLDRTLDVNERMKIVKERVAKTVVDRKALQRFFSEKYGSIAGIGNIEQGLRGRHGAVHSHALNLMRPAPRDRSVWCYRPGMRTVQEFLQRRDCSVPGCPHIPGDRCDACKLAKTSCSHPHPDGRPRCNGSWYVDLRVAYSKDSCGQKNYSVLKAVRETTKYTTKPPRIDGLPAVLDEATFADLIASARRGEGALATAYAQTEYAMMLQLALFKRHRIETYGLAKQKCPDEEQAGDDLPESTCPLCPICHQAMQLSAIGVLSGLDYHYYLPRVAQAP